MKKLKNNDNKKLSITFLGFEYMPTIKSKANQLSQLRKEDIKQIIHKFMWLRQNFAYCLGISALIWIIGLVYYIETFIGWDSVLALNPSDFGEFLFLSTLPLLVLWFILAYIERSSSLDANAVLFQNYIDSLLYPNDDASKTAKNISKILQEQIAELQKENKNVINQSNLLKNDLDNKLQEFANILQSLDNYSSDTLTTLDEEVKKLADRCTYITNKTTNTISDMQDCSEVFAQNSDNFLGKLSPIVDEISALSSNIKSNIADNRSSLAEIKNQLIDCTNFSQTHIDEMLAKTVDNTLRVERSFSKVAEEYDVLYKRLDASISNIEGRIDDQKNLITKQNQVLDQTSDVLSSKLSSYGKTISAEIDKLIKNSMDLENITKQQIATLKSINNETSKTVTGIGSVFDEKRVELERRCEYAINSMQNVVIALNKETDKLVSFTSITQAKNSDLQNIAETIVDKIGDISNKLALKTDNLKDKAVEVIDKFTEASEIITRSTDKINSSSGMIVDNSKQGLKLLEEQSYYINNTVTNMDKIKDKLASLRLEIKDTSSDIVNSLSGVERQIAKFENIKEAHTQVEQVEPEVEPDDLILLAKNISRILQNLGINPEKLYNNQDMFDLWDAYIEGKHSAFVDVLASSLSAKNIKTIRKQFEDNTSFHNIVIKYLFLMDLVIKDILNPDGTNRNELLNLSVNTSLDKVYFVLIKALNSTE